MSPRPYRLGQRQAAIDETRARVIAAARELLVSAEPGRFSIDAVAQRADVSRATVYYQFGSKLGLLEALFDSVGATARKRTTPNSSRSNSPPGMEPSRASFGCRSRCPASLKSI